MSATTKAVNVQIDKQIFEAAKPAFTTFPQRRIIENMIAFFTKHDSKVKSEQSKIVGPLWTALGVGDFKKVEKLINQGAKSVEQK